MGYSPCKFKWEKHRGKGGQKNIASPEVSSVAYGEKIEVKPKYTYWILCGLSEI
jgi:hypothetical protein